MSAPLICTDRSAVEVKDKSVFALLYVCVCVYEWVCGVQWGQPSLRSEEACRNVPCLWRVCCLCSTNIRPRMKGMWLHKAPSSPVLLRDPARFFHPPASVVVGDEEGTYILMRWAGLQAAAQRGIRADRVQDEWITVKLRSVGVMLVFFKGRFS